MDIAHNFHWKTLPGNGKLELESLLSKPEVINSFEKGIISALHGIAWHQIRNRRMELHLLPFVSQMTIIFVKFHPTHINTVNYMLWN